MTEKNDKHIFIFAFLVLAIVTPLFAPGFISTLDMIFTPNLPLQPLSSPNFLLYVILHFFSLVFPVEIVQKALLICILFIAASGAYLLAQRQAPTAADEGSWQGASIFAGVFYLCNPFTYTRFIAGQFEVLLGYALLPLFAYAVLRYTEQPSKKRLTLSTLILVAISIASLHIFGMALLVGAVLTLVALSNPKSPLHRNKQALLSILGAACGFIIVSLYWIIPALAGKSNLSATVGSFGSEDKIAFATHGEGLGVIGNVLSLRGFWGETKNLFLVPQDIFSWWLLPVIMLWAIVLVGISFSIRHQRRISLGVLVIAILGMILATGTSGTIFAPFNEFLSQHVPFFNGYREPQKFVALIALAYCYFGSWGVYGTGRVLSGRLSLKLTQSVLAILLVVPIALAPLMMWGFHDQLKPRRYPVDWYAINDRLKAEARGQKTLFLPWHLYMRFNYADRVIANPAKKFFEVPVITSNNPELEGAKGYGTAADQRIIEAEILPDAKTEKKNMADSLRALNIKYVLLAKEADFRKYSYLDSEPGIKLIQETINLKLYEVQKQ